MAFYYSRRKLRPSEEETHGELNIVPYLDVLMNLIIFMLLSMTGLASFGVLNVSAPSYGAGAAAGDTGEAPKLLLSVSISKKGFYIAGAGAVLGQTEDGQDAVAGQGEPTVPLLASQEYDYAGLNARIRQIKAAFPSETKIIVAAESAVPYEALVATMDACRESMGSDRGLLFPDVTLGAF